jgi:hypothetical protein
MGIDATVYLIEPTTGDQIEVTAKVFSVNITRGKSRQLDYYEPGSVTVVLNNFDRAFDPLNDASDFQPFVFPKRRITVVSNGISIFSGLIDEWSFTYDPNGESYANVYATEDSGLLANMYMFGQSFPQEFSGARVDKVLDNSGVAWSTGFGDRLIDDGTQLLDASTVGAGTNALEYLRQIETSEQGALFYSPKNFGLVFKDNNNSITSSTTYELFADDGTINYSFGTAGKPSIPYEHIDVSYTSQLMYNSITVNAYDNVNWIMASNAASQESYGVNGLTVDGVLYNNVDRLTSLGGYLIRKYGVPEYRINSVRVNFYGFIWDMQEDLVLLELGDFAKVKFKPNGLGTAIERVVQIIGINHEITPGGHSMTLQFDSVKVAALVLDDTEFGKLDTYVLGL